MSLNFVAVDVETANSQRGSICSFGLSVVRDGKIVRNEDWLTRPPAQLDWFDGRNIGIHGITPGMVKDAAPFEERLAQVLEVVGDLPIVAHNAAFDMRFLQLKEAAAGLRFDQPVLDTLLLSAWVHPNQESHRLEAIAERLGVKVMGRHTALGDAFVTAEVYLKLIPLLQAKGVHTLGEARNAALQTYQARLKY